MSKNQDNKVLSIEGVNKKFGGLQALKDINLNVIEGETHAIIGPNGAGKSTLLNVCIGQLAPDSGQVKFNGNNIIGKQPHEINQMGMARVFQTPEIFPDMSLLHNLMIPAFAKRDGSFEFKLFKSLREEKQIEEEATKILWDFGMADQRHDHAGSLSRGDKRRLELGMCLIQHPRLLLLDEPTAGMARHDTNRTIELLQEIKETGMTKIIIEHDMQVVFTLADRISVLAQGQIIVQGLPDEIKGHPKVRKAYLGNTKI